MRHEVIVEAKVKANTDFAHIATVFKEIREIHTSYRLQLTVIDYQGKLKLYEGDKLSYTEVFGILEQSAFWHVGKFESVITEVREFTK